MTPLPPLQLRLDGRPDWTAIPLRTGERARAISAWYAQHPEKKRERWGEDAGRDKRGRKA